MSCCDIRTIETDIVVVGSGSAGSMAALTARRQGCRVALVDKGGIYRSGCGAAGEDHFHAVLEEGEEWDTPEAFIKWVTDSNDGLINPKVIENSFLKYIKSLTRYMEDLGVKMRLNGNEYIRTGAFMSAGKYMINFDGVDMPTKIAAESKKAGVDFFPRTAVADLMIEDGRVVGVAALEYRTQTMILFKCKAVILCTGNATRMFDNMSGVPYNTWNCPYNNGLGQRVAFMAGAQLANMEFIAFNVSVKNFGSPGLAGFTGMGAHIVNALGERIVFKYHPMGENGPRWAICKAVYTEIQEGRGPIYIDSRPLKKDDLEHLLTNLLPVDKKSMNDLFAQKGIDLRKDLLEVEMTGGESTSSGDHPVGILIDENMSTSVPGIYAAGACALACSSLSASMCTGIAAAEAAASYIMNLDNDGSFEKTQIESIKERVFRPLEDKNDPITYTEFEDKIRQIMSRYVRVGRTAVGLQLAMGMLDDLAKYIPNIKAENGHELMRSLESQELLTCSQMIARGALVREESRFGLSHYRTDFPETSEQWRKSVLQRRKADDSVEISYNPAYN